MGLFGFGVVLFLCASTLVMGIYYFSTGRFLKNALLGAAIGVGALLTAKLVSGFVGFAVTVNAFTVLVAAILGFPGAACTVILGAIFGL